MLGSRLALLPPDAVGISAISVEESLRGRLAQLSRARSGPDRILRYALLIETVQVFQQLPLVPFDQPAETRYQQLLNVYSRVGRQDLKIAAVALVNNLVLLTRNRRDFAQIPGLTLDDWSV
jgi:tRNA(fMet)-specific endonuclease VapC